ncbi:MAG: hypothetical protein C4308_01230 [Chitinophagaceae bacterium]
MKAAKDKVDYLLTAIGEQTGKPLVIKEIEDNISNALYGNVAGIVLRGATTVSNNFKGLENQISFIKIKIRYDIFARFSIQ